MTEEQLHQQMGVARALLRAARKNMAEGSDFAKQGRAIIYTESGIKKMRAALGLAEAAPAPSVTCEVSLRVVSYPKRQTYGMGHYPNRHLIRAAFPEGRQVWVRVTNPAHYYPGTPTEQIRAVPTQNSEVYDVCGRAPRYAGRW